MKKAIFALATMLSLIVTSWNGSTALAYTEEPIKIQIDGKAVTLPDAHPFIDQATARIMVPVRFVSQELGATVEWDAANRTVKMNRQGKGIALRIGEKKATINGQSVTFDAAAQILENRTFVPLRFISEAYGADVVWHAPERLVTISTTVPVIKDDAGKNHPVQEADKTFQAFHNSLVIKNGVLSGTVPKSWAKNIRISFELYFKDGNVTIMEKGGNFSCKANDVLGFAIIVLDTAGRGKRLALYSYRNFPSLVPMKVVD